MPPLHYAVPKSDGDGPVQAWMGLLPGRQPERARRIDAVVTREVPDLRKAVKWHPAWYGVTGQGWLLSIGSFKAHLKLVFLNGDHLVPKSPVFLKSRPSLAPNLRERGTLDEGQLADWVRQASRLPGWGKA